jgi:hypothetical protein
MKRFGWVVAAGLGLGLFFTGCGGGVSTPPPVTTYTLTVNSTNPVSGVTITVSPADSNGAGNGTTSFSRVYDAGTTVTLSAPVTSSGNNFVSWSGCTTASTVTCTVAMNANATVTAGYATPVPITPTVTVTPSAASITTAQALTVTVAVSAPSGDATPTGSVTLTSGSYTSAAATLSGGSATIQVAAGALALGSDTLTASYAPDAASNSTYTSATGTATETVIQAYTLTVNSTNPASGVLIGVTYPPTALASQGTTSFTLAGGQGETFGLSAPSTASGNNFSFWTGCTSVSAVNCNVTLNGNMTVTANYVAPKITPTVTVTPSASSITTAQALTVTIAVSAPSGDAVPTGTVTLTSGSYSSTAATLSSGSAKIQVAAGALAAGGDTLTASYAPDTASSSTYNSATGTAAETVTAVTTYTLTVNSIAPTSGVDITAVPSDVNNDGYGPTPLTLTYAAGTAVVLTAPTLSGGYGFVSWSGCASATNQGICNVTMSANTTVTATYNKPNITSITVTPSTAIIGKQVQFAANVVGTGSYSKGVTWALSCPSCGSLSAGTLSTSGLYTTPYPAPATVVVTATSTATGFTNVSGSATVTLNAPATATGPALTVDAGKPTHAISPYIYGMNAFTLVTTDAKDGNITVDRFGGDATSRYNYLLDVTSSASDWYFENQIGNNGVENTSEFNEQVISDAAAGVKTLGTVDVLGWVAKNGTSCSFPTSLYPGQQEVDVWRPCGNGVLKATGANVTGNDPTLTSTAVGPSFAGDWVTYLVSKFGTAANGGVFAYDLDNEPAWWDAVHRDVHPVASTYDEVTINGIATAEAIKTADPTAAVNGPVIDYWWNYFYSKKDVENGWGNGSPCWEPWSNPIDRKAHGGVPMIEYYLQQFAAASATYGSRLLDYLDMHTYDVASYNGSTLGFALAGDTGAQQARLNSTRVFWDPTYTDPNLPQPNYPTDSNYTASCSTPLQAPQLIPMAQGWVAKDYPGTKVAFTEYNWGGQESINGALAQADILGIFGSYGLDMGALWGAPDPATQLPGLMAFEIYRNYDGKKSTFGDTALASTSGDQGQLAVYGAVRGSDNAVTVVVINKTYGALTSTLSLAGVPTTGTVQAYLYSNANQNAIVAQTGVTVTPPAAGSTTSTIANYSFPAQSITLFVVPQ